MGCGLTISGGWRVRLLREAELVGGRYLDSVVYSLLASEAGRIVPGASQLQG